MRQLREAGRAVPAADAPRSRRADYFLFLLDDAAAAHAATPPRLHAVAMLLLPHGTGGYDTSGRAADAHDIRMVWHRHYISRVLRCLMLSARLRPAEARFHFALSNAQYCFFFKNTTSTEDDRL